MNAHERIIKALNHEESDRIPLFCQIMMSEFKKKLLNYWGPSYRKERRFILSYRIYNLEQKVGFDAAWDFNMFPVYIPQKYIQDHPVPQLNEKNQFVDFNGRIFLRKLDSMVWSL